MKIIPALTGPMSGKLGGMVASRNRGGQYFRRKAVPVNPDSTLQVQRRSAFASLIAQWNNNLTPAQREAWTVWALNTPRIDSLGQTHILTGQNAFVGANSLRMIAGQPVLAAAPTIFNRGEALSLNSVQYDPGPPALLDFAYSYGSLTSAAGRALLFLGRPQNESVEFFKGPYRFAGATVFSAGTANIFFSGDPADLPFLYGPNQKIPARVVTLYDDGRYSAGYDTISISPVTP